MTVVDTDSNAVAEGTAHIHVDVWTPTANARAFLPIGRVHPFFSVGAGASSGQYAKTVRAVFSKGRGATITGRTSTASESGGRAPGLAPRGRLAHLVGRGGVLARRRRRRQSGGRAVWWEEIPRQELLDVRLCDLELSTEDSPLAPRVARLYRDLERAGLRLRPHVWLSTDWFSPEGVPGIAVPFYLAHPRLARLERAQMLHVEGGNARWCLQLLRHETGHAIDSAYHLHRRKAWRRVFGPVSRPYRPTYVPNPKSRRYVRHLPDFYAQSHPLEDFAETFAIWLQPGSRWQIRYRGWPALRKLVFVDALMREIGEEPPVVRSRERTEALSELRTTLREYYERKRRRYGRQRIQHRRHREYFR